LAARTTADGVGAREWLEMGGEKKLLGMSELGCADGCGRRGCKEWLEMGGEKKPLGMSELGCADGCGRRGHKGVARKGWVEISNLAARTAVDAVFQGSGWKWVRRRSCWG